MVKVLLLGSGGREHAIAWKLAQSPRLSLLISAPGNPGMARHGLAEPGLDILDGAAVVAYAKGRTIDLVVVGPEAPLAAGVADACRAAGIAVVGPSAAAARLEASKGFTKALCDAAAVPTAAYQRFSSLGAARANVAAGPVPIVVKADGLAAGKGVTVASTHKQADEALVKLFAEPGAEVVVEAFMEGEEASFFVACDGEVAVPLLAAQDHKRLSDGDTGPNTGGMGAYAPAPVADAAVQERALREIILPTLRGMQAEGTPFRGILFAGLMISEGVPRLIEFNVRFGDPECQTLLPLLDSDLLALFAAAAAGDLRQAPAPRWREGASCTIVLAANGYPEAPLTGSQIRGVGAAAALPGVLVFHAGTRRDEDGSLRAAGGRVLNVTATAPDLRSAAALAYTAAEAVDWPGGFYRRDIGHRVLAAP
jgi:phosphoribosylamine--glycine ligase